ncbi:hypothetical protein HZA57_09950, partial [Candidatus Poribacteria bacterium]|nr:hypothetical protein [Candidatus Poribacteria bacterium]
GLARRRALAVVQAYWKPIIERNKGLEPKGMVPIPGQPDSAEPESYDHLIELEKRYGHGHTYLPRGCDREFRVGELLEGVRVLPAPMHEDRKEFAFRMASRRQGPTGAAAVGTPPSQLMPEVRQEYAWNLTVLGATSVVVLALIGLAAYLKSALLGSGAGIIAVLLIVILLAFRALTAEKLKEGILRDIILKVLDTLHLVRTVPGKNTQDGHGAHEGKGPTQDPPQARP